MGVSKKDDKEVEKVMEIILPYVVEYTATPTWGSLTFNFENSAIKYVRKEKIDLMRDNR